MSVIRAIAVFLVGFFTFRPCVAQIIFPGVCPDVAAMPDFNPNRYLGKWYEAEKYFSVFELGGRCITAEYVEKDNGIIGVINKQLSSLLACPADFVLPKRELAYYIVLGTGIKSELEGEAMQVSRSDEGKLSVRFPSLPVNIAAPYWIVDTDYNNYAVVWSCYDFGIFHTRNAWLLTRERHPPLSTIEKAYAAIEKNNINKVYFMRTDQSNCIENEY